MKKVIIIGDGIPELTKAIKMSLEKNNDIVVNNHEIKNLMRDNLKPIEIPIITWNDERKFENPKSKYHK